MKKSAATQVRHLDLTKYIEGKQFADGVHQILTRKDGKKILLRFEKNKPIELIYKPRRGSWFTVNVRDAVERTGAAPRGAPRCVFTIHEEKPDATCTYTLHVYNRKYSIWGYEVNVSWLCVVEDCESIQEWFE